MEKIKSFIKKHKFFYSVYYAIMSLFVNVLKLFVKTDDKLILFVSYGGRHYSDSPRKIYEAMRTDKRFADYKLVWAFVNPQNYDVPDKIKIDSVKYFKTALKARCWITNVMIERALNFKGKNTFYFFTSHGILVKLGGKDMRKGSSFDSFADSHYDFSIAQSEYEKKISESQFGLASDKIAVVGMPKNDILANYTEQHREEIRNKLGIPNNKKAILYAPTFREYNGVMNESFDINISDWRITLSDEYVLLYRAHPVVSENSKEIDDFFIDVTNYEEVEDLMIASDMLISDYSGIIFDYCIMQKPIILFTYDYEKYSSTRGLYFDIRQELPYAMNEKDLLNLIKHGNYDEISEIVNKFRGKYATEYGCATEKCLDIIYDKIQN